MIIRPMVLDGQGTIAPFIFSPAVVVDERKKPCRPLVNAFSFIHCFDIDIIDGRYRHPALKTLPVISVRAGRKLRLVTQ